MTLKTIANEVALDVGLPVPDVVATSADRTWIEMAQIIAETCDSLARRVDWGQLHSTVTLTGDGTAKIHDLPPYFDRISDGIGVLAGTTIVRPLTRAEFNALTSVEGLPRYFLLEDAKLRLWPYLADSEAATVSYQSGAWCSNGANAWTADGETSLIDERLVAKGAIARWRRQKGMDYADQEAEFEAALTDRAQMNDRSRL